MLNHSYKPSRHITEEEQILNIKEGLTKLKERIIANVETNIHDKCGENTFYYYWSGLDLSDKIPTDTRTERLRDVIHFCVQSKSIRLADIMTTKNHRLLMTF